MFSGSNKPIYDFQCLYSITFWLHWHTLTVKYSYMYFDIKPIPELFSHLESVFETEFKFNKYEINFSLQLLRKFLGKLPQTLYVGIEYPYIDKLHRDTYYSYYSSKLASYHRDCIRLSFFKEEFILDEFHSSGGSQHLQDTYIGFLVLRPTPENVIGRNVFKPNADKKFKECYSATAVIPSAVNGIKLTVEGFPHSSQDTEFIVCAETTLWAVMEYFSNRYAEYKPVLPKTIHRILAAATMQRQVPSSGLTVLQISFALKELGFGVKLYSSASGSASGMSLEEIVQVYVESGIPVLTAIQNSQGIGHVMNIIGRTTVDSYSVNIPISTFKSGKQIFSFYEKQAEYLTIDDNMIPYDSIPLNNPARNYTNQIWAGCTITGAVVPLYHKIYMDAERARELAIQALKAFDETFAELPNLVLRVLLSSSRSFKHSISMNRDLDSSIKILIVTLNMPKFVWIAEIGNVESFNDGQATGMLLMDATEPRKTEILAYLLENMYIGTINGKQSVYSLPLRPFSIHHNLKPF